MSIHADTSLCYDSAFHRFLRFGDAIDAPLEPSGDSSIANMNNPQQPKRTKEGSAPPGSLATIEPMQSYSSSEISSAGANRRDIYSRAADNRSKDKRTIATKKTYSDPSEPLVANVPDHNNEETLKVVQKVKVGEIKVEQV